MLQVYNSQTGLLIHYINCGPWSLNTDNQSNLFLQSNYLIKLFFSDTNPAAEIELISCTLALRLLYKNSEFISIFPFK